MLCCRKKENRKTMSARFLLVILVVLAASATVSDAWKRLLRPFFGAPVTVILGLSSASSHVGTGVGSNTTYRVHAYSVSEDAGNVAATRPNKLSFYMKPT